MNYSKIEFPNASERNASDFARKQCGLHLQAQTRTAHLHNALINMVFSEIGNIRNMQMAKKDAAISIRGSVTRQTRPKPNLHPLGMESHKFQPNL